jgi:hypothetical protein
MRARGKAPAAGRHEQHGRERVARLLIVGTRRTHVPEMSVRYLDINGEPAALILAAGSPYLLASLDLSPDGDTVSGIYVLTNPDKLVGLRS